MKSNRFYSFAGVVLFFLFCFTSCQKGIDVPSPEPEPPVVSLRATVTGRVVNENKVPVSGASIAAGTVTTTTDINGYFQLSNVLLDRNAGYVKVEKSGYFAGSRTISVQATNYIEVELIPKVAAGSFSAAFGGTVTVPNGGSIQFDAASVMNESTKAGYTGTVQVAAFFLDPSAANFSAIMPGDLRGTATSNEERGLQSFGMLAVELTGASGEKLNIASGKSAKLTFPIPSSIAAQAPATIPLWYFDEAKGLWKEEGTATKQGLNYVGTVGHFSFWNVDAPFPLIDFEAVIKDNAGKPLPFTRVEMKLTGNTATTSGSGYTDSTGKVWGKVPAGKTMQLVVYSQCNSVIHTQDLNPMNSNTNLGNITVNNGGIFSVTLSGTVVNCSNAAVTTGFVSAKINGRTYMSAITGGTYNIVAPVCVTGVTAITLNGYDQTNNTVTDTVMVMVTGGGNSVNKLTACGTVATQYINFSLNGTSFSLVPPADSLTCYRFTDSTFSISGFTISGNPYSSVDFSFKGTAPGTFPLSFLNIFAANVSYRKTGTMNVSVTEFGAAGQYIAGSFNGNVIRDSTTAPLYPVSGTFRVRRQN